MRITTRLVLDINGTVLEHESYEWDGDVALCKGGDVANQQRQQELNMQQQAFNLQQQQLNFLNTQLSPYLTGNVGFTPEQLASMQSQFLNNNALQFNQAGQSVRQSLAARGGGQGDMPVSGDYVRGLSGLMGAAASSQAQGLLGLNTANAQQALANKFNAASVLSGNAATLSSPIASTGQAASSALQSYIQAQNSGFLGSLARGLGSALGGGLGAAGIGGLGAGLSGFGIKLGSSSGSGSSSSGWW